VWLWKVSYML